NSGRSTVAVIAVSPNAIGNATIPWNKVAYAAVRGLVRYHSVAQTSQVPPWAARKPQRCPVASPNACVYAGIVTVVLHRLPSMLPLGEIFPGRPVRLPRLCRRGGPVQ